MDIAAEIAKGTICRRVNRRGAMWGDGITPKAIWHVVKRAAERAGIHKLAHHGSEEGMRQAMPPCERGIGADSVSSWARVGADHGAVLWLQAELAQCGQRQHGT